MRKVFLDDLVYYTQGKNVGCVNWNENIGKTFYFIYDDQSGYLKIVDVLKSHKICVEYEDNIYCILGYSFLNGKLGSLFGKHGFKEGNKINEKDFELNIGDELIDENRHLIITNRKNGNGHYYQYICKKCGFDCRQKYYKNGLLFTDGLWNQTSNLINKKQGCACCNNKIVVEGINDIPTTDPWMIPYFPGGYDEAKKYTYGSSNQIHPKCQDCGLISNNKIAIYDIHKRKGFRCRCSDKISFPERFMMEILNDLSIDFIYQYSDCDMPNGTLYDFMIPSLNTIIETDGGWGHGYKGTIDRLLVDNKKDESIKHKFKVIRINCEPSTYEHIKNSIIKNKDMNALFDLSKVNWDKCNELAQKNLKKQVCLSYSIRKTNPKDLALLYNLSSSTIVNWLNEGNKYGWCKYSEVEKYYNKYGCRKKAVNQYTLHGKYMKTFESSYDAQREVGNVNISNAIKNEKSAGGYLWKYDEGDYSDIAPYHRGNCKMVVQINKNTKEIINIFESLVEAANATGTNSKQIWKACNNHNKIVGGYLWRYADEIDLVA